MSYIVIKSINGRRYRYEQRSYREGGKVRTESRYLGPVDASQGWVSSGKRRRKGALSKIADLISANRLSPGERGQLLHDRAIEQQVEATDSARAAALADLHARYGLTLGPMNPTPIDKPASAISLTSPAASPAPAAAVADTAVAATEGPAAQAAGPEGSE